MPSHPFVTVPEHDEPMLQGFTLEFHEAMRRWSVAAPAAYHADVVTRLIEAVDNLSARTLRMAERSRAVELDPTPVTAA